MKLYNINYEFSVEKNRKLVEERGVSFDEVIELFDKGLILDTLVHQNKAKYPNQEIHIVNIKGYVYLVPFVKKSNNSAFLKTIIPSRKLTKKYLK